MRTDVEQELLDALTRTCSHNLIMNQEIIAKAVVHYGIKSQVSKAMEEMAELMTELARSQNDRAMNINIVDEIADVAIMIEQLKLIFGADLVQGRIGAKMKRLEAMIMTNTDHWMRPDGQ